MAKRVLVPTLPKPDHPVLLPEREADHLTRVLRLRDGDHLEALDGQGHAAQVVLRMRGGKPCVEFVEAIAAAASDAPPVTLELSVLKGDAMEWAIEKAVELGARAFVPVLSAHTIVQLKNKGPDAFRERWQKIADQALKQCGRLERMEVAQPVSLEELLTVQQPAESAPRLWFDEYQREQSPLVTDWLTANTIPLTGARLLIGPEGGWSAIERDLLLVSTKTSPTLRLSLGPWVLRAETAAISATSLLVSAFRSKSLTKIHQ